jgi:DNA-binding MarR family transcriptional regulator
MNQRKYERFKQEAEAKCQQTINTARAERDATIAALERVWKLLQSPKAPIAKQALPTDRTPVARGKLTAAVGSAIQAIGHGKDFTLADVAERMRITYPDVEANVARSSISGQLRRLAGSGMLVEVVKGRGKRASRYKLVDSSSSSSAKAVSG